MRERLPGTRTGFLQRCFVLGGRARAEQTTGGLGLGVRCPKRWHRYFGTAQDAGLANGSVGEVVQHIRQ